MILIIDNQSEFIKELEKYFKKLKVKYLKINCSDPIDFSLKKEIRGIILSGGTGSPFRPLNLITNFVALINFKVPIMGFCLGHEIIATAFGGSIKKLPERQTKMQKIVIDKPKYPILKGLKKEFKIRKQHYYKIKDLPENFIVLAHSEHCDAEIIRHKRRKIYGFQGHPEKSGEDGRKIIRNFLKICKEI